MSNTTCAPKEPGVYFNSTYPEAALLLVKEKFYHCPKKVTRIKHTHENKTTLEETIKNMDESQLVNLIGLLNFDIKTFKIGIKEAVYLRGSYSQSYREITKELSDDKALLELAKQYLKIAVRNGKQLAT